MTAEDTLRKILGECEKPDRRDGSPSLKTRVELLILVRHPDIVSEDPVQRGHQWLDGKTTKARCTACNDKEADFHWNGGLSVCQTCGAEGSNSEKE